MERYGVVANLYITCPAANDVPIIKPELPGCSGFTMRGVVVVMSELLRITNEPFKPRLCNKIVDSHACLLK